MKLGKQAARYVEGFPKLRDYATFPLPVPAVYGKSDKLTDLGMMLNDRLGDCTCAAIGHLIQAWTSEAGKGVILSDAVILKLYEKACGFDPERPDTDQGGIERDALDYWMKNPVEGHVLSAYVAIDWIDPQEIKEAVY
jgi:hypothetical protein